MNTNVCVLLVAMSGALGWGVGAASADSLAADSQPLEHTTPDMAEPLQDSCGDRRCAPPEDCHSCPADCGSCCGNHRCEPPEDANSCPADCG